MEIFRKNTVPQNFHNRKLGENTVFCAVYVRYPRSFNARSHASVIYKRVHFVILGGGITGDILSWHKLSSPCEKLLSGNSDQKNAWATKKDTNKALSPSRNEMVYVLLQLWELLQIDTQRELKSLFVTNALDGSEFWYQDHWWSLEDWYIH